MCILNSSPEIIERVALIKNLDEKIRERLIDALELVLLYSLDRKEPENFLNALDQLENHPEQSMAILQKTFWNYAQNVFEFEVEIKGQTIESSEISVDATRALIVYYGNTISESEKGKKIFRTFIENLAKGNYKEWRAWNNNPDKEVGMASLIESGLLPQKVNIEQYSLWQTDMRSLFEETLQLDEDSVRNGIKQALSQAVADQHIKQEDLLFEFGPALERYEIIVGPLSQWSAKLDEFRERIKLSKKGKAKPLDDEEQIEYKKLQSNIMEYRKKNSENILKIEAELYLARLRNISVKEIENQTIAAGGRHIPLRKAFETINMAYADGNPDFLNDIRRIQNIIQDAFQNMFSGTKIAKSSLLITDEINLERYIKIGEEPVPSCQSYASNNGFSSS